MATKKKTPETIAKERIAKALRTGATELDLSSLGLRELPDALGQLTQLQILNVRDNQLTALPDALGQLAHLQSLDVAFNQLTALPDALSQLAQLQSLDVSGNQLAALPNALGQLVQLQQLIVSGTQLTALPDALSQLAHLRVLVVSGTQLTALPDALGQLAHLQILAILGTQLIALPGSLGQLAHLRQLIVSGTQLTALPDALGQLAHLQHLDVSSNQLTALPDALGQLAHLQHLDVSNNQLTALPESLQKLSALEQLYLHGNDQLGLPVEVLGPAWDKALSRGATPAKPADILEYYFRMRGSRRPLNEAKLILVGRGGVGKTSLVKRLVHNTFKEGQSKTEGIQITSWQVQVDQENVRLNIWDFGGQEIMHATHQFFLTERSLYLLVLNGREGFEERDAESWLKLIESFGGDSPVIVVLNKIKQHSFELNYRALQAKYPQIRDFVRTDCEPKTGIDELHQTILKAINSMAEVWKPFPANWFFIKDWLAGMSENYLSLDRYRELCRKHGERDEKAQDDLAGYLHCLGIALNYRDDPRLRDTSVLNPRWVTEGIYRLLNAEQLAEHKGVLRLEDLKDLLPAKGYPSEKHEFLLELMRKFKLCFAFSNDEQHRYLVPELLDKQEPDLRGEFNPQGCLNFEYHYSILPEGLLPNFIVRTHILSTDQARWRSGVVLNWEGCRALVKADTADGKTIINVRGPTAEGRRRLLAVIRSDFERIHGSIPKLEVTAKVPVPGHPEIVVDYKKLIVFEAKSKESFDEVVGEEVIEINIQEMLNGVDLEGTRRRPEPLLERSIESLLKLFYSYSHKDEALRDELETHLKLLQRQGHIALWHDRKILGGEEWKGQIDANLEAADIILLLVSADFIASDYCYDLEMDHALQRHKDREARVIPVIIRDCVWDSAPFSQLQALPKDGRPVTLWPNKDTAWKDVARGIQRVVQEMRKSRLG